MNAASQRFTEALNRHCQCQVVDADSLHRSLDRYSGETGMAAALARTHPHLFSRNAAFIGEDDRRRMAEVVAGIETVVALPGYRAAALAASAPIARHPSAARGVFMGFDFHLSAGGPRLIEINTNAGGALLNLQLARSRRHCCPGLTANDAAWDDPVAAEAGLVGMFRDEWRLGRGDAPLRRIAIVDDDPARQYLYPEFLLFRELFRRHGLEAVIADAARLVRRHGALCYDGQDIDLVYNRLTDFALADPAHAALRDAWLNDEVVLTPHPRTHALYADKRNLALLGAADRLRAIGAPVAIVQLLCAAIPQTLPVTADNTERLWSERRRWFFKPAAGYGSRAAYRGDKLTRRVFDAIRGGGYVAQALIPPSERHVRGADGDTALKLDVRNYAYAGAVQLTAVRLYQGQTTNFRTPGGGFAPVYGVPSRDGDFSLGEVCDV